jgi:hypothetical protein
MIGGNLWCMLVQRLRNRRIIHQAMQSIAAQQQRIARLPGVPRNIRLCLRLHAQYPDQRIAGAFFFGAAQCISIRKVMLAHILSDPAMILRYLRQRALAHQIGAAIADMADQHAICETHGTHHRRPHCAATWPPEALRELIDCQISFAYRLLHATRDIRIRIVIVALADDLGCHPASAITVVVPAHPVSHQIQIAPALKLLWRTVIRGKSSIGVLVTLALQPPIDLLPVLEWNSVCSRLDHLYTPS